MFTKSRYVLAIVTLLTLAFTSGAAAAARTGAWVDEVVFVEETDQNKAVARIESGELDLFTLGISDADLFKRIKESGKVDYEISYGSYNELTYNPAGPILNNGTLNPLAVPAIREATHWMIDRNYICNELMGGMAVPRYTPLNTAFADYARYADVARRLELQYSYNLPKAKQVIAEEMTKLGATMVNGKWTYKGQPVTLIILIRLEDERREIGDYVANQFEAVGFTVDRQYKRSAEASPIWNASNPADGKWHVYTGGWISTLVNRDLGDNFSFFYTKRGMLSPLWQAYNPDPEFDKIAERLSNGDFKTMEERQELMARALELSFKDSVRVFICDRISVWPRNKNVSIGTDVAAGMSGSRIWAVTARFNDKVGGKLGVANTGMLVEPWNPIGGTNWVYDMMIARGTGDGGMLTDPYTGLYLPQRVKKAEVVSQEGLPVAKTHDWVDLKFVPEIKVPADAWYDWDAKEQRWITVGEKFPGGTTAKTKVTIWYDDNVFKNVKWHDGSTMSAGDLIFNMIVGFDMAKPESAIFDQSLVSSYEAFMSVFKGARIISVNPFVFEYYTDAVRLDAEDAAYRAVFFTWPYYNYGQGSWHVLALGYKADAAKELSFTKAKSDQLKNEWMSFIAGPSLNILSKHLDQAAAENFIPYANVMGKYVTAQEAATRYANLKKWYQEKKHFWIGTGPLYLDQVRPVEKIVVLKRFADYPDPADKWAGFGSPKLASVSISGTTRVNRNRPATFTVNITTQGKPYLVKEVNFVKYMVFDSKDNMVLSGEAQAVKDGQWQIALSAADTAKLPVGSTRVEVVVSPIPVSIPAFQNAQFVTLP